MPSRKASGRGDVDRLDARRRRPAGEAGSAGEEGRVEVDVVLQVDQIRHIAVLPEELRWRDQPPGVAASNW